MIKCDYCGCTITSDIKKNKYIYLACSKYKGNCPSERVREEVLLEQIKAKLKQLIIPKEVLAEFEKYLKESNEAKKQYHNDKLESLQNEYKTIQGKLDGLLDMRIGKSITILLPFKKLFMSL